MSGYELRDGQGTLFKNDRKSEDKHPDYTGSIKLPGGGEHWLSAWIKHSNAGKTFMSIQVGNPKDQVPARKPPPDIQPPQGRRGSMKDELSDDVPF